MFEDIKALAAEVLTEHNINELVEYGFSEKELLKIFVFECSNAINKATKDTVLEMLNMIKQYDNSFEPMIEKCLDFGLKKTIVYDFELEFQIDELKSHKIDDKDFQKEYTKAIKRIIEKDNVKSFNNLVLGKRYISFSKDNLCKIFEVAIKSESINILKRMFESFDIETFKFCNKQFLSLIPLVIAMGNFEMYKLFNFTKNDFNMFNYYQYSESSYNSINLNNQNMSNVQLAKKILGTF